MKVSLLSCFAAVLAGTISVEIEKHWSKDTVNAGNNLFRALANEKGSNPVSELLTNGFYLFYATLYIGSDNQKIIPQIDTGSSDLWVMKSSNPYCADNTNCVGMEFDTTTSTTYHNLSIPWNIQYLDTTGAFGFLGQDTVRLGDATVDNAYVAVADIANSTSDVFGIGFRANEASVFYHKNGTVTGTNYPNYPASLKEKGLINTIAYSLYLNTVEAQDGIILFGGVDHAKYYGTLGLVPLVNVYAPFIKDTIAFNVILNSVSVISSNVNCALVDGFSLPVLLDSGTSFAILPPSIVDAFASAYNYTYNSEIQFYEGDCNILDFDGFELDFSGIKLSVPAESLLAPANDPNNGTCILALEAGEDITSMILGDVFMRNFYIVYDLEHYQVALAQAKFTEDSDIEEIVSTILSATSAPGYYNTAFVTAVTSHSAGACETHTTTASPLVFYTDDSYLQSSMIYGVSSTAPTPSATANSSSNISRSTTSLITGIAGNVTSSKADSNVTAGVSSILTASAIPASAITGSAITGTALTGSAESSIISKASSRVSSGANSTGSVATGEASSAFASSSVSSSGNASTVTTTILTPTVLTTAGQTFTVNGSTVLTITDCGCTERHTSSSSGAATNSATSITGSATTSATQEFVSAATTTIPTPTTLTTAGQTFTVTGFTVLTISDCGCTEHHTDNTTTIIPNKEGTSTQASSLTSVGGPAYTTTTKVVSTLITTCSTPTIFSTNGKTFTVTEPTVLTITDCPCTLTHSTVGPSASTAAVSNSTAIASTEDSVGAGTGVPAAAPTSPATHATPSSTYSQPEVPLASTSTTSAAAPHNSTPSAAASGTSSASRGVPSVSPVGASTSSTPALANKASKTGNAAVLFLCGLGMLI